VNPGAAASAGLVLGLAAGFSPGPLFALVVSLSLRHGAREGMLAATAPLVTDAPIVALSLLALFTLSGAGWVLGLLSVGGGLFAAWLGINNLRYSGGGDESTPAPRSFRQGVAANFLSPYPYVFWLTVGAPLVVGAWKERPVGAVLFLALFYASLVGSKLAVALAASRSRALVSGRVHVLVVRALGVALLLFAILFIRDGFQRLSVL